MNEKTVRVGIDVKAKNTKRKATFAIRELKRQVFKHFRSNDFVLDNELNSYFWKEGKSNAPSKVSITGVEDKDKLYVFLEGSEAYKAFKKSKEKPKDKKAAKKTDKKEVTAKKEVKTEVKAETKKETKKIVPKKTDKKSDK